MNNHYLDEAAVVSRTGINIIRDDYISKPINMDELYQKLNGWLSLSK